MHPSEIVKIRWVDILVLQEVTKERLRPLIYGRCDFFKLQINQITNDLVDGEDVTDDK